MSHLRRSHPGCETCPPYLPLPPSFPKHGGTRHHLGAYHLDFKDVHERLHDADCWKLERGQHFREPRNASWRAFNAGAWEEALRLAADSGAKSAQAVAAEEARGAPLRRLKIVKTPLTPYQQWELHVLHQQVQHGRRIRILSATAPAVRAVEAVGPLPEVVTLGSHVVYHVHYTPTGVADGATAYTDPRLIQAWSRLISYLYQQGEPLAAYFRHAVKHLPPPKTSSAHEGHA